MPPPGSHQQRSVPPTPHTPAAHLLSKRAHVRRPPRCRRLAGEVLISGTEQWIPSTTGAFLYLLRGGDAVWFASKGTASKPPPVGRAASSPSLRVGARRSATERVKRPSQLPPKHGSSAAWVNPLTVSKAAAAANPARY